jgi:DNA-binding transcriptional regulator YhcF (GntR family)
MEKKERVIKVRDMRRKDQYKIDDAYLNGYARICGVNATAVYNSLSRHSDFHTQECFPSIEKMAEQHGLTKPTIIKAIATLKEAGIIQIIKEKDPVTKRQLPNVYLLADKSEWKEKSELIPVKSKRGAGRKRDILGHLMPRVKDMDADTRVKDMDTEPGKIYRKSRVKDMDRKDTKGNKENTEDKRLSLTSLKTGAELPATTEPIKVSKKVTRKINEKLRTNYNWPERLRILLESKEAKCKVLGYYFLAKDLAPRTYDEYRLLVRRLMPIAMALIGYSPPELKRVFKACEEDAIANHYNWTLETALKKAQFVLKN